MSRSAIVNQMIKEVEKTGTLSDSPDIHFQKKIDTKIKKEEYQENLKTLETKVDEKMKKFETDKSDSLNREIDRIFNKIGELKKNIKDADRELHQLYKGGKKGRVSKKKRTLKRRKSYRLRR